MGMTEKRKLRPWEETWLFEDDVFRGRTPTGEEYERDMARARLAAAAPELYRMCATLMQLTRDVEYPDDWAPPTRELDAAISEAINLLAKARGGY